MLRLIRVRGAALGSLRCMSSQPSLEKPVSALKMDSVDPARLNEFAGILSDMGVLHQHFHLSLASKILPLINGLSHTDLIEYIRIFSVQNLRQMDVMKAFDTALRSRVSALSPSDAARAALYCARLALYRGDDAMLSALIVKGFESPMLADQAHCLYAMCLGELDVNDVDGFVSRVTVVAPRLMALSEDGASLITSKEALTMETLRLLTSVRSVLRHCHREQYDALPEELRIALRKLARTHETLRRQAERAALQSSSGRPKGTKFARTLSEMLTKLRIANEVAVHKGGFLFDVVERDQRLVWACSSVADFFAASFDKVPEALLSERVARGMGFKVANTAWWQWGRMRVKRTRYEYVRMARYYALRDRREFDAEFEGWRLAHLHKTPRRALGVHIPGYFTGFETKAENPY